MQHDFGTKMLGPKVINAINTSRNCSKKGTNSRFVTKILKANFNSKWISHWISVVNLAME